MAAEQMLYGLLTAPGATTLAALVAARIYPDAMPEEGAYPALVYSCSRSSVPGLSANFGNDVTATIGCWAQTRTSADEVAAAVATALTGSEFYETAREPGYDNETGLFATNIIFSYFESP